MFMEAPKGFGVDGDDPNYVLKLKKNLYGQKQAGRVWNKHLVSKLASIGFEQARSDECVFYRECTIFVLYTDDSLLAASTLNEIQTAIANMKQSELDLMEEGDLDEFLGVKIERVTGGLKLSQPQLIDKVLK